MPLPGNPPLQRIARSATFIYIIALAEIRSLRRTVSAKLLAVGAVLVAIVPYLYYAALHGAASGADPVMGWTAPRYVPGELFGPLLTVLTFGTVLLASASAGRDASCRIFEVIAARPLGNGALLVGRTLGVVLVVHVILAIAVLAVCFLADVAGALDWPLDHGPELLDIAAVVACAATPAVFLWTALTVAGGAALRSTWAAIAVGFAALGGTAALATVQNMPGVLRALVPGADSFPLASDLVSMASAGGAAGSAGSAGGIALAWGAAAIAVGALLLPRLDSMPRVRRIAWAAGLATLGALTLWNSLRLVDAQASDRARWQTARANGPATQLGIERLTARLDASDPDHLAVTARLHFETDGEVPGDSLRLSLNPGWTVLRVALDDASGAPPEFVHEDGVLELTLPDSPVQSLTVEAAGRPRTDFGYVGTDMPVLAGEHAGLRNAFIGSDYLALMPGIDWLPMPLRAPDAGRDFFAADLRIVVPGGWLAAAPGLRAEEQSAEGTRAFAFSTQAPVDTVAVFASEFQKFEANIDGVALELLLHRKHADSVEPFRNDAEAILTEIGTLLAEARELGLAYPHGQLSVVEVPRVLRMVDGGWTLRSNQSMPGILLMSEQTFPAADFDFIFTRVQEADPDNPSVSKDILLEYFRRDRTGGNLVAGLASNLVSGTLGIAGPGEHGIRHILDGLAARLLFDDIAINHSGHFVSRPGDLGEMLAGTVSDVAAGGTVFVTSGVGIHAELLDLIPEIDSVPLSRIGGIEDRKLATAALLLRADAIIDAMLARLTRAELGALLSRLTSRPTSRLRENHRGMNLTAEQFTAAVAELDPELGAMIGAWIDTDGIPAFRTSAVRMHASRDTESGGYQYRVHVVNNSPVPGLVSLESVIGGEAEHMPHVVEPVVVPSGSAVEIGWSQSELAEDVWLLPYLSANRGALRLAVADAATPPSTVLNGSQPSAWRPRDTREGVLVVDDQDAGFSIREAGDRSGRFFGTPGTVEDSERFAAGDLGGWRRSAMPGSWGRARRSAVWALAGDGNEEAVFVTRIPHPGRWALAFHVPPIPFEDTRRRADSDEFEGVAVRIGSTVTPELGVVEFAIGTREGVQRVRKDLGEDGAGWFEIGEFVLDAGDVTVSVSNATDGTVVVADALRWTVEE